MTRPLAQSRVALLALLLLLTTATGCVGTRFGVSWAALDTVGERQNILVAFNNEVVQVDPIRGDRVPLLDAEGRVRVNPETGLPRIWRVNGLELNNAQFFSTPVLDDDNIMLFAEYGLRLLRVDPSTARVEPGSVPLAGHVVANLSTDGERVFIPLSEQNVQALWLDTLEQAWMFETENGVWSQPVVANGTLYITSLDQHLYAVDAETGEQKWRVSLQGAVAGDPVLYEDSIYAGSFARRVFRVSLEGEILAEFATNDWVWGKPTVVDGVVYVADMAGFVYALSADDLSELWRTRASSKGIRPAPLVADGFVIVGARDGQVKWLDRATGEERFSRQVDGEVLSDLLLIRPNAALNLPEPLVIVSTVEPSRLLVAFTLSNAGQQWVYPPQ